MASRFPSRAQDERALRWVQLRAEGKGICAIANMYRVTESVVEKATHRIRKDDLNLSGEPPLRVAAHYWKLRGPKA